MKDKIIEIIRRVCSHWIVADKDELNRVSEELESELKSLYTSEIGEDEIEEPYFKKAEVRDGVLDIELESEHIVRFYIEHMKTLFDSIDGANNFYTVSMRFSGETNLYSITFQKHPGITPAQEIARLTSIIDDLKSKNLTTK